MTYCIVEQTLNEYDKITRIIENIQENINNYKKSIEYSIENATNDQDQEQILNEFRQTVTRIKEDKELIQRYKQLKKRQEELKDKLVPNLSSVSSVDNAIIDLKLKYSSVNICD